MITYYYILSLEKLHYTLWILKLPTKSEELSGQLKPAPEPSNLISCPPLNAETGKQESREYNSRKQLNNIDIKTEESITTQASSSNTTNRQMTKLKTQRKTDKKKC